MTQKQEMEQQQSQMLRVKNSGILSYNGSPMIDDKDEEMTMSALSAFRAKEEEIERKKMEVRERVQAQLGRAEEETKRLAEIREVSRYRRASIRGKIFQKKCLLTTKPSITILNTS